MTGDVCGQFPVVFYTVSDIINEKTEHVVAIYT